MKNKFAFLCPSKNRVKYLKRFLDGLVSKGIGVKDIYVAIEQQDEEQYKEITGINKVFIENSKGVGYSRMKLIEYILTKGYFGIVMFDDDIEINEKIFSAIELLELDKDIMVIAGHTTKLFEFYEQKYIKKAEEENRKYLLKCSMNSPYIARIELFNKVNYDERLKLFEDKDILLQSVMAFPEKKFVVYNYAFSKEFGGKGFRGTSKGGCSEDWTENNKQNSFSIMELKNYAKFYDVVKKNKRLTIRIRHKKINEQRKLALDSQKIYKLEKFIKFNSV